jgi:hypothetical protein
MWRKGRKEDIAIGYVVPAGKGASFLILHSLGDDNRC